MAGNTFSGSPFWIADPVTGQPGSISVSFGGVAATAQADNADAQAASATANKQQVAARNYLFNGATWDRARGDTVGAYTVEKNRCLFYVEAPSQTLAIAATFTGATRDVGVAPGGACAFPRFGAFINASQAGTLTIQGSDDNFATSYVVATQAVAAATPIDVTVPVRARYHRAVFTNGAAAQTSIVVKTGYQT